uniref:Myb-like domain-containing protein n=1 Tax=Rhizophora mucronata TaxID=61149 RepID=A0A2P2NR78_RHIMU
MDDFSRVSYGWTWEENKLFEMALAVVDEDAPDRWEAVAVMVGGKKSAVDVEKHYAILLEDLQSIESGKFDHKLSGEAWSRLEVDSTRSLCWTDEDHKYVLTISQDHWIALASFSLLFILNCISLLLPFFLIRQHTRYIDTKLTSFPC